MCCGPGSVSRCRSGSTEFAWRTAQTPNLGIVSRCRRRCSGQTVSLVVDKEPYVSVSLIVFRARRDRDELLALGPGGFRAGTTSLLRRLPKAGRPAAQRKRAAPFPQSPRHVILVFGWGGTSSGRRPRKAASHRACTAGSRTADAWRGVSGARVRRAPACRALGLERQPGRRRPPRPAAAEDGAAAPLGGRRAAGRGDRPLLSRRSPGAVAARINALGLAVHGLALRHRSLPCRACGWPSRPGGILDRPGRRRPQADLGARRSATAAATSACPSRGRPATRLPAWDVPGGDPARSVGAAAGDLLDGPLRGGDPPPFCCASARRSRAPAASTRGR